MILVLGLRLRESEWFNQYEATIFVLIGYATLRTENSKAEYDTPKAP